VGVLMIALLRLPLLAPMALANGRPTDSNLQILMNFGAI
jgi:hypothetical protein